MRVVLYAEDMEPITVIDLPEFAEQYLTKQGMVRLAVPMPVEFFSRANTPPPKKSMDCRVVTIFAERLVRRGREHMMLFTSDDESALLLKCAFLPGQQSGLLERERAAFARGFLEALARVGG